MVWRLVVWELGWNGLEAGDMGDWELGWMVWGLVVWELGWNGLGMMLDTYKITVGLLEKIPAHSSRVFEANTAANFVFISGCKITQDG